jgi:hypothetical protein
MQLIAFGAAVQVVGYAIMAPAPPFPVLVLGYFLNGFGLSFQVSHMTVLKSISTSFPVPVGCPSERLCGLAKVSRRNENGYPSRRVWSWSPGRTTRLHAICQCEPVVLPLLNFSGHRRLYPYCTHRHVSWTQTKWWVFILRPL